MEFHHPDSARIFIIEGIAGSGKDTFHRALADSLSGKRVFDLDENQLLRGWKHMMIPGLGLLRLEYFFHILDYIEKTLIKHPDTFFILTRFHLSTAEYLAFSGDDEKKEYDRLIKRLHTLPVFTYIATLDEDTMEARTRHVERTDPLWEEFLNWRLTVEGYPNLRELYTMRQKKILEYAQQQRLPYATINIASPNE